MVKSLIKALYRKKAPARSFEVEPGRESKKWYSNHNKVWKKL